MSSICTTGSTERTGLRITVLTTQEVSGRIGAGTCLSPIPGPAQPHANRGRACARLAAGVSRSVGIGCVVPIRREAACGGDAWFWAGFLGRP